MLRFVLPIAIGCALRAQGPAPTTPAPPTAEDLCSIQGAVLNAVTGEPLKKATLNLMRTDMAPDVMSMPSSYSTSTDSAGKFAMKDIEPGKYRLSVNRNGFVAANYGARGPMRPGTTLSLVRGQSLKEVTFRLTPHGVIAGRIFDEDGEPVPYARIQLLTYRYLQGKKQLSNAGGASSNDLGEYRVFGIAPGKYYLSAMAGNMNFMYAQDRSAAPQPEEDYVATYYPGTIDASTAVALEVTAGGQLRDIDLRLSKAHTIRVKGHVTYSLPGRQRVTIYMQPRNPAMGGMMGPMRPSQADAKGNFELRGVAPGAYYLTAAINDGNRSYQARMPVDAGRNQIENLELTVRPGIEITGRVRIEGAETADLSNVRLMLQPREWGMMFGYNQPAKMDENRGFKIENVSAGLYNVTAGGLPAGYYLKSVRAEQVDVMANGLNAESAPAPLDVVLSPNAAQLTGVVENPNTNQPSPGATIVLVPQEGERKDQQIFYKQVTSDQNGAYHLKDLTPGEYKIYAWEDVESGAYLDPDFMKPFEAKGEAVTLREGDQKSLQVTLIPAESAAGQR